MVNHVSRTCLFKVMILAVLCVCGCTRQHYFSIETDSIELYYKNVEAREVLFASSIDQFTPHPATNIKRGLWRVTIPRRDNFSYFYLVDKIPEIPRCEFTVEDDFGGRNCFFALNL